MKEIERPDIVAVYDLYGLRIVGRGGTWKKAQCPSPDHMDANPSASINEDTGKWTCFSCGRSGDGLDIIAEREGLARLAECQQFAEEKFGAGNGPVRGEPVRRQGLSVRPGNQRGGGSWTPTWRNL